VQEESCDKPELVAETGDRSKKKLLFSAFFGEEQGNNWYKNHDKRHRI
jgi:hypothetical protein